MTSAPPNARTSIFVTHAAPEDNEFALWLSAKLAIAGYRVWVDRRRLKGGTDFWDEIDRVLRNDAIKQIVVFSMHIGKPGVKKELAIGDVMRKKLSDPKFIIPIRIDDIAFDDPSPKQAGDSCCAAQMFLNSGNGVVFRGALGPWRSSKSGEFHLSREKATELVAEVIRAYTRDHAAPPEELFIHARQRFSDIEWDGFTAAVPARTRLVGVRIRPTQDLRLFRPDTDMPVLRGTAVTMSKREGYLWTTGYIPRLRTYPGFETPKPILVEVNRGDADLQTVMRDVLALTKINYNACDYSSGLPVTLKFADRVGEILTASPEGMEAPPMPFRFYI